MGKIGKVLLGTLILIVIGISAAGQVTDYSRPDNWVICEAEKSGTAFDVFYIYPTLFGDKNYPLMRWHDNPKLKAKTIGFARAQTGIFGGNVRRFAPYVRQLEYGHCREILGAARDGRYAEGLEPGAADTKAAFLYYLENFNNGRPYILFGHSQGSVDLYRMMLSTPEVSVARGFVAAYLLGLPVLSTLEIASDFSGRGIHPAACADDIGVIIGWNTQAPGAKNPYFIGRGTYCINPLNWRTDETPASNTENSVTFFYDYRNGESILVEKFCGARIDTASGALLVELPVNSGYDAKSAMGKGVFHMNDVWFFAGNIRSNAFHRVKIWLEKMGKNMQHRESVPAVK